MSSVWDERIAEGQRLLDEDAMPSEAELYVKACVGLLESSGFCEKPKVGLNLYRQTFNGRPPYTPREAGADIQTCIDKMRLAGERRRAGSGQGSIVTVNSTSNSSSASAAHASAHAEAEVSFAQVISNVMALPDDELDVTQKAEIAAMLAQLEEDGGGTREGKAMEVVRWLGDKGFEVVKAVAPTLLKAIMGM